MDDDDEADCSMLSDSHTDDASDLKVSKSSAMLSSLSRAALNASWTDQWPVFFVLPFAEGAAELHLSVHPFKFWTPGLAKPAGTQQIAELFICSCCHCVPA